LITTAGNSPWAVPEFVANLLQMLFEREEGLTVFEGSCYTENT